DKAESSVPPLPWISNLRPVMESLDATLGGAASTSASSLDGAPAVVLKDKGPARDAQVLDAMATMRSGFDRLASPLEPAICGAPSALRDDARVLGAWLLSDGGDDTKTLAITAKGLLEEYRDWHLLLDLVRQVTPGTKTPQYTVDFTVATVPDYVDSNS